MKVNGEGCGGKAFNKIFEKWKIPRTDRVEAVIHNDTLNEELARKSRYLPINIHHSRPREHFFSGQGMRL